MTYRVLFLLALAFLAMSCSEMNKPSTPSPSNQRLQPALLHSGYWSWNGKDPILLLGAGGTPDAFTDPDYKPKLNLLAENGGNFVQIAFYLEWLDRDIESLLSYLTYASDNAIAVELTITANPAKAQSPKQLTTNKRAFSNLIRKTRVYKNLLYSVRLNAKDVFIQILREYIPSALVAEEDYLEGLAKELQAPGAMHWPQLQDELSQYDSQIIHLTSISNKGEVAAEGIAAFNRSVLAGAAAVRHLPLPQKGEGFTGPALAGIRAIRTVQQHFDFWSLQPAPELTPSAKPNEAYAFTDGFNGFLIYLPTAGSVELLLPIEEQVPMRVTVVGYLGSQKSELLKPPYNNSFTLFTDEPRGGWMLIKPER